MILRYREQRARRNPRLTVVWDQGASNEEVTAMVKAPGQFIIYTAKSIYISDVTDEKLTGIAEVRK